MNISKSSSGAARIRIRRSNESLSAQLYKVLQGLCVIVLMLIVARAASAGFEDSTLSVQALGDGDAIAFSVNQRRSATGQIPGD